MIDLLTEHNIERRLMEDPAQAEAADLLTKALNVVDAARLIPIGKIMLMLNAVDGEDVVDAMLAKGHLAGLSATLTPFTEDAPTFAVVCAWCGDPISGPENADMISHGMCAKCAAGPAGGHEEDEA